MALDEKICRQAMRARDPRFDGRFFIGVLTTRIYCRPVCRVKPPKIENVRFFPTAAAASEAGLRPCLRCRPETSPGTPAWLGSSGTVTRALRLIASGALERGSVEQLAAQVGIGTRQLDRLFRRHVGAAPLSVARTRRLQIAKQLIDETTLPMAQVATAAGFGSQRSFNVALRETYNRTPTELRNASRPRGTAPGQGLQLQLSFRLPFDWDALIGFLEPRALPGIEEVSPDGYRRTIELDGKHGWIDVRPGDLPSRLQLKVHFPDPAALCTIVHRVRRIFDLDAAPDEIASYLGRDSRLAPLVRRFPGLRVPGAWDAFEVAVRAILGQQVSVKAATTLASRIVERFGMALADSPAGLNRLFPAAGILVSAELEALGVIRSRAATIRRLSRAILDEEIVLSGSTGLEDFVRDMTALPGIGPWTAHYVALRGLAEPDAFPAADLGLLRAFPEDRKSLPPARLLERAEAWRPWRSYAALLLWKNYESQMREDSAGGKALPPRIDRVDPADGNEDGIHVPG